MRTGVKFMCVNKIETMYERPRLNVTTEGGSTVAFQYARLFIHFLDFIYAPGDVKLPESENSTFELSFVMLIPCSFFSFNFEV